MKKKLLSLLMVLALVLGNVAVVSAAEAADAPTVKDEDLVAVTGAEAIAAIGTENTIFLDLRAAEDFAAGHIKGSVSAPVCQPASENYAVPVTNQEAFIAQMNELKVAENNTTIYLSCYAGTFCVNYAADWLMNDCGVQEAQLIRVSGGTFGDADLAAASIYTSPAYALNADGIILDVRATDTYYANGYIDGSIHLPVFVISEDGKPALTGNEKEISAFNAFVDVNKDLLASKNIYVLCNSGSRGAVKATELLAAKGITKVFTIEGGAAADAIKAVLVKQQFVSGTDTVAAIGNDKVAIVDVRTKANFDKGHLKGAISIPVFGANGASNGYDEMAASFLAGVAANADKLAGKDIYLVCNSGASGAKAATKLLMRAGYSNADIFTVTGGNKGAEEDKSVPTNSTYVSADQALSVLGNDSYVVIDVRAAETVKANGQLKGAVQLPVFVIGADGKPALTGNEKEIEAFVAYVKANKAALEGKTIYVLCNSGSRGAVKAIELLAAEGITNVFTIEGGATNQSIKDAFVTNTDKPADKPADKPTEKPSEKPSSPATGDMASPMGYILIMLAAVAVILANKKRFA